MMKNWTGAAAALAVAIAVPLAVAQTGDATRGQLADLLAYLKQATQ